MGIRSRRNKHLSAWRRVVHLGVVCPVAALSLPPLPGWSAFRDGPNILIDFIAAEMALQRHHELCVGLGRLLEEDLTVLT